MALISFCLRWLDGVNEEGFGYAAGALARIPEDLGNAPVKDVVRRYPFTAGALAESSQTLPARAVASKWSTAQYARIIEPHLRFLLLNETHDPVIPLVMRAWNIDVGLLTQDYQISSALSAYKQQMDLLRASVQGTGGLSVDDAAPEALAAAFIAERLQKDLRQPALEACTLWADKLTAFADKLYFDALTGAAGPQRDDALAKAERYRRQGVEARRLLTRHLGADLDGAIRMLRFPSDAGMGYSLKRDSGPVLTGTTRFGRIPAWPGRRSLEAEQGTHKSVFQNRGTGLAAGAGMSRPLVPDELWTIVEPLLPDEPGKPMGRRPRIPDRACLTGIIFVLKSGIAWDLLLQERGCGSSVTCWRRLRAWQEAGLWTRLHRLLLDRLGEADRIDWSRASVDSATLPAKGGR